MSAPGKLAVLVALLIGVSIGVFRLLKTEGAPEMSYSHFLRELDGDQVERVSVKGFSVAGQSKNGKTFHVQLPYLDPQLADDIASHCEATFVEDDSYPWEKILVFAVPALALGLSLGLWTNATFSSRPRSPSPPS